MFGQIFLISVLALGTGCAYVLPKVSDNWHNPDDYGLNSGIINPTEKSSITEVATEPQNVETTDENAFYDYHVAVGNGSYAIKNDESFQVEHDGIITNSESQDDDSNDSDSYYDDSDSQSDSSNEINSVHIHEADEELGENNKPERENQDYAHESYNFDPNEQSNIDKDDTTDSDYSDWINEYNSVLIKHFTDAEDTGSDLDQPKFSCPNDMRNVRIPHFSNRIEFFVCFNGNVAFKDHCGRGQRFDFWRQRCVSYGEVQYNNDYIKLVTDAGISEDIVRNFGCPPEGYFAMPHEADYSKFEVCYKGEKLPEPVNCKIREYVYYQVCIFGNWPRVVNYEDGIKREPILLIDLTPEALQSKYTNK